MMTDIARRLEARGYHLRSGGAIQADQAFARGASKSARTIYVPWRGFNELPDHEVIVASTLSNWEDALLIAEMAHPAWEKCSNGSRKLLARNAYQILGTDLFTPSEFVIGWTQGGRAGGGTGQAYRIALDSENPPPIYDLGNSDVFAKFDNGWLPG